MIGYARCSTKEQNLDSQLKALKDANCIKIFHEKISGADRKGSTILQRPVLAECLQYLRPGDTLVVTAFDRITRSFSALFAFTEKLKEMNVELKILKCNIDTKEPIGKVLFYLFGLLAEMERDNISSRTKAGLEAARARGRFGGRRPKLNSQDKDMLWMLYQDSRNERSAICKRFNISTSTFTKCIKEMKEAKSKLIAPQPKQRKEFAESLIGEEVIFRQQAIDL